MSTKSNSAYPSSTHRAGAVRRRLLAAVAAASAAAAAVAGTPSVAPALKPVAPYASTPEQAKITYDDVTFGAVDGTTLHGWFLPFQDQEGKAFREPAPIVIMPTDGNDNMGSLLWHYYNFFRGAPWHVLMFDWRGFGSSARWNIDTTLVIIPEFQTDLAAAIDYAKERPEFDGQHLGILACEAAAAVALAAAATRDDVDAVAVRGAYTTQAEFCARCRAQKLPVACTANPGWPAEREPIRIAPRVKTPVLVVVGESDALTPPAMAQALHAALAGPKQYWVAPRAGHTGFESPEYIHLKPFTVKLHGFFGRHLGTAGR
jgi:pimeloyl-ACP methyl ester carboxylesterase